MLQFFPLTIFQLNCFEICNIRSHRQSFSNPKRLVGPPPLLTPSHHVSSDLVDVILLCVTVYMFCWLLFYLVGDDGGTFWFELIPLHEPGSWLCNRSTSVLRGRRLFCATRFCSCVEIFHFKIVSTYLPATPSSSLLIDWLLTKIMFYPKFTFIFC